ncbi:MAG: type III-B CRISPR-associated protein Cas10/Cmr2 [Deltaproteobacteria bacterium]|nr:type III-B CRISPR-associated protein Cas10/Cmr2 [Deltaproteobacteria bacterium]
MSGEQDRWQVKLAAWVHDPAEKALVLFRDPSGHEGGTTRALLRKLFGDGGIPSEVANVIRWADRWAAAADRPQFPVDVENRYAAWARVDFVKNAVLVHPLTGKEIALGTLVDTGLDPAALKAVSTDHLERLILRDDGGVDWKRTFLNFWQNAQVSPAPRLGALWQVLPADTRVPDHSIWEHLRLTSAFAGAMANGDMPAILAVSLGPVQSFIAQGRSTSDLWAGSHLLSHMAWEAMRVVAERFGPDAILFPDLHGVPIVTAWLRSQVGVDDGEDPLAGELKSQTDANPLFAAALPNRFVAIVPAGAAEAVARDIVSDVRSWVLQRAKAAWNRLGTEGEVSAAGLNYGMSQIGRQLDGFPDVHWCAVPWKLVETDAAGRVTGTNRLGEALSPFYPADHDGATPGFLGSAAWKVINQESQIEGMAFFQPNGGVLYPAIYDLLDRALGAFKTSREFSELAQEGYRCSLCGIREVLCTDEEERNSRAAQAPMWSRLERKLPAWLRENERLCGVCLLKRLWPVLFTESSEVKQFVGEEGQVRRFVVSTHTMALATTLQRLVARHAQIVGRPELRDLLDGIQEHERQGRSGFRVALPRKVVRELRDAGEEVRRLVRALPGWLDDLSDQTDEDDENNPGVTRRQILRKAQSLIRENPDEEGSPSEEAYYALVLMDGDHMGAWLSGAEPAQRTPYRSIFHPAIRAEIENRVQHSPVFSSYLSEHAPPSPSYHAAISRALNGFSLHVARRVVEDVHCGKLIYSGGDDVLAMSSVKDVLSMIMALRCAYSGTVPASDQETVWRLLNLEDHGLLLKNGYALIERSRLLLRTMGERATASAGVVIAHHKAPLGSVLREARAAERAAKAAGRDAFSISLMKRSGGITRFTSHWYLHGIGETQASAAGILFRLRDVLETAVSRRFAYHTTDWLQQLPANPAEPLSEEQFREMLATNLQYQLGRQSVEKRENPNCGNFRSLAEDLAAFSIQAWKDHGAEAEFSAVKFLADAITVAEFLARPPRGDR